MLNKIFFIIGVLFSIALEVYGQAPVANFTADKTSGCNPTTVQFTSTSTGSSLSYNWDFGDGTGNSAVANPGHVYNAPGTYTVTLTVSNSAGTDVETKTNFITIYQSPTVDFTGTPTIGCPSTVVNFTDNSILNVAGAGSYSWN